MPPRSPGANVSDAAFYSKPRFDLTLAALQEVARIVKDVPGVKPLMWVTAGFRPPSGSHEDLARAMRDLAAAKVMLYPVDARGVLPEIHAFTDAQNLGEFAEQTGGRAYFNNNDTAAFLRAALEDSREGYLLTYAPRDYRQDGSDHKVRLDSSRKGVTLRYRPGYVADHAP
jgi:VWFA-related protein